MKYPQITQIPFPSCAARKNKGPTVESEHCHLAHAHCSISNRNLRNLSNLRISNFGFWVQ
jgi:hypothetical protein